MRIHSKKLLFNESLFVPQLYQTPGVFYLNVPRGRYKISMRGAGGAGGVTGGTAYGNSDVVASGGAGGAGGTGELVEHTITVVHPTRATIYVGVGGKTYANGGNGGAGGAGGNSVASGAGGGGGHPTYIVFDDHAFIDETDTEIAILYATGGGGGGGGGSGALYGRYRWAGCGGGGGGYYRLEFDETTRTATIKSIPGKAGRASGGNDDANGPAGLAGNTVDFPTVRSGRGGRGGYSESVRSWGGAVAYGGGASGGGGGAGAGNHSSAFGGGGGGGAGGCLDAGGGFAGIGKTTDTIATAGYNAKTIATASTDYLGQDSALGRGGTTNTNGGNGWLYIINI